MRRLKLIGIGTGNPDHITVQGINALVQVDVVFVTDKGRDTKELLDARKEICARYMRSKPYRIVEIRDAERDRTATAYRASVAAWHGQRAELYEQALRDELCSDQCGAFLVWGDHSLYDSTLRIIQQVAARRTIDFELEIIPGITSIQALAASHQIPLNQVGEPVHITTGRRLKDETFAGRTNVVVLLDGECSFNAISGENLDIYWGAYLGTSHEILLSGKLTDVAILIEESRQQARRAHGWIMDTYLLRTRDP